MPASDSSGSRALGGLVWFNRWLGIATGLIFAGWFASGAVMLFQPFPSLSRGAQMSLQAPVDGAKVAVTPLRAIAASGGAPKDLRLVQRAGQPAYLTGTGADVHVVDGQSGAVLAPLSPQQARREAQRLFGSVATVIGPFDYDQWIVHDRFDPARPFYRIHANDAAGTQLYLSARTGEMLQRTTRSERAWNWPGAVLHWAYVTPLRKNWAAWNQSVWCTGKVGDLAGFASASILGLIAMGIGLESMMRFFEPTAVAFGEATVIAVIGLAVNIASAALLSGEHDHHHHHGHQHGPGHTHGGDNNLRSAYVHVLADALTSVLAIAALLAGRFAGWTWMDPAMGIVGTVVIARWSWTLMRDTARVLLDAADPHIAEEIRSLVEAPGDARIIDLHVWRIGPDAWAAIVSAATSARLNSDQLRSRLAPVNELVHLTIERQHSPDLG